MTETIQQLKEDIAILQEKLRKLEEQDPEMLLLRQGKVDIVDYDGKKYFSIEYTDSFAGEYSWYVRRIGEDAIRPVRDVNLYAPLEELYQKEVVKQKDDYPYKKYTPEKTAQSLKEAFREAVKQGVVSSVEKKPQTLYDVISDWWDEVFTEQSSINDLVDKVSNWLPKEHDTNSYKWNECIKMIRGKLR